MTLSPQRHATVQNWVKSTAHPLTTTDPLAPLDDLRPLLSMLGEQTSVVGYGAGTRGAHEVFAMQARIARLLVAEAGFSRVQVHRATPRFDAYLEVGPVGELVDPDGDGILVDGEIETGLPRARLDLRMVPAQRVRCAPDEYAAIRPSSTSTSAICPGAPVPS